MNKDNKKSNGAKAKARLLNFIENNPEKTVNFIKENTELFTGLIHASEKITQAENEVKQFEKKLSSCSLTDLNDNELRLLYMRENAIISQNSINGKIKTLKPISKLITNAVIANPKISQGLLWTWLIKNGCTLEAKDKNSTKHLTYEDDKVSYINLKNRLSNAKAKNKIPPAVSGIGVS